LRTQREERSCVTHAKGFNLILWLKRAENFGGPAFTCPQKHRLGDQSNYQGVTDTAIPSPEFSSHPDKCEQDRGGWAAKGIAANQRRPEMGARLISIKKSIRAKKRSENEGVQDRGEGGSREKMGL